MKKTSAISLPNVIRMALEVHFLDTMKVGTIARRCIASFLLRGALGAAVAVFETNDIVLAKI
jgi:hypothetical protein